ncbi:MAG: hypothetical protein WCF68_19440 [Terriglobales bacterium]
MANGTVTAWTRVIGQGLVTEDGDGVHKLLRQDCTVRLQAALDAADIPPNSVRATFDLAAGNRAINADLGG